MTFHSKSIYYPAYSALCLQKTIARNVGIYFGIILFSLCFVVLLIPNACWAQTVNGFISGTVVDPSGAVIPGATVEIIDQQTTNMRSARTRPNGAFLFPDAQPGKYNLAVIANGFKRFQTTGILLTTGERLSLGRLKLTVGATTQVVKVSSLNAPIETTSSQQSMLIGSAQISQLPDIGGDYMALTAIVPGSTYMGNGNSELGNSSSSVTFEGVSGNNSTYVSTNGVFSSIMNRSWDSAPTIIPNIQNVQIITSGYEAQYGKAMGGIINVTTKSGTDQYHGSLWYSFRNEALNANDYFNKQNNEPRSRYRYNTIMATLGGPVIVPHFISRSQHKLFFFFSWDYAPSTVPQGISYVRMPTTLEREGNFSQSYYPGSTEIIPVYNPITHQQYKGNIVPSSQIVPIMQKLLNWFPLPNFTNTAVSKGQYNWTRNIVDSNPVNQESIRLDYVPDEKWHIFGRWQRGYFGSTGPSEPGIYADWSGPQSYTNINNRIELNITHIINENMFNELSGGYTVNHEFSSVPKSTLAGFQMASTGMDFPQQYPGTNPLGMLPGFSFNDGPGFGYDPRFPMNNHTRGYSIADNLTYILGNHDMKFGIYTDGEYQNQPHHAGNGQPGGSYSLYGANPDNPYNVGYSFAEGLLGYYDNHSNVTNLIDDANTAKALQWYAQDNWQVTQNLALNYGIRFTYDIPQAIASKQGAQLIFSLYNPADAPVLYRPVEVKGKRMMENPLTGETYPETYEDQYVPDSGTIAPGSVTVGSKQWRGLFASQGVLTAPRFGFSYNLFGDNKTAIRGGIGRFYAMREDSGYVYNDILNAPAIFYPEQYYGNITDINGSPSLISPPSMTMTEYHAKLPYSESYSLGIQHLIGFHSVLNVSYVGSISRFGKYSVNLNEVPYGAEFLPQNQDPTSNTPLPDDYFRPYPGYSSINKSIWGDNSNYNSLQVKFTRRMMRGLAYGVAYTYSKSLDDNKGARFIPASMTYGPIGQDMRHRLVVNWVWALPSVTYWDNRASKWFLNGWEISGIASFISGQPNSVGLGTTTGENITGGGDGATVIVTGKVELPRGKRTFDHYFNPNVFALPAKGQIGNAWKGALFYGPGVNNWNMALAKNFYLASRVTTQFRLEADNAFNHPQWSSVNTGTDFNPSTGQQINSALGRITGDRGPRIVQLALRISF